MVVISKQTTEKKQVTKKYKKKTKNIYIKKTMRL